MSRWSVYVLTVSDWSKQVMKSGWVLNCVKHKIVTRSLNGKWHVSWNRLARQGCQRHRHRHQSRTCHNCQFYFHHLQYIKSKFVWRSLYFSDLKIDKYFWAQRRLFVPGSNKWSVINNIQLVKNMKSDWGQIGVSYINWQKWALFVFCVWVWINLLDFAPPFEKGWRLLFNHG